MTTTAATKNKFYALAAFFISGGWFWLLYALLTKTKTPSLSIKPCFIKTLTGIPCPSCGTTRSIESVLQGHISGAIWFNPLGIPATLILLAAPIWLLYDLFLNKTSLYHAYFKLENLAQRKRLLFTAFLSLIVLNWIWNIYKYL